MISRSRREKPRSFLPSLRVFMPKNWHRGTVLSTWRAPKCEDSIRDVMDGSAFCIPRPQIKGRIGFGLKGLLPVQLPQECGETGFGRLRLAGFGLRPRQFQTRALPDGEIAEWIEIAVKPGGVLCAGPGETKIGRRGRDKRLVTRNRIGRGQFVS